ncbi:hypothetical protein [Vibrio quintilis]|uniref:Uncharacterized protein n=1 Tax=Vibrio quintilis TaxID=1117707 RepID=A0A1M7YYJ1_9VIBR|nr:hypothetical protein [Vibrio quintilis]SHO57536.1 hypothetical protein VQ7734_03306 [Vibrio quintilis]
MRLMPLRGGEFQVSFASDFRSIWLLWVVWCAGEYCGFKRLVVPALPSLFLLISEVFGFCELFGALVSFVDSSGFWCPRPGHSFCADKKE